MELNMDKVCRICLLETTSLHSLQEKCFGDSRTIAEVLRFLTNLPIKLVSGYPNQACDQCVNILCQSDIFKRRCIESETKLLQLHSESPVSSTIDQVLANVKSEEGSELKSLCSAPPFQCNVCFVKFQNATELNSHTFSLHLDKLSSLSMIEISIDKSVPTTVESQNHEGEIDVVKEEIKVDTEEEVENYFEESYFPENVEHECTICSLKFSDETSYVKHNQKHNDKVRKKVEKKKIKTVLDSQDEFISCDKCNIEFKNLKSYKTHIWKKHPQPIIDKLKLVDSREKIHECNVCMRKFMKKTSLAVHLKKHDTSGNLHVCAVCKREFKHQAHLDNHVLSVHTTNQGLKCDYCELYFASQESLDLHKSVHSANKKHQCNLCSKAFNMLSTLKDHLRVHTGEKPFLCPTCGKGFSQNTNLIEHLRRHQGIKPFKCDACERRFVSKGELAAHTRKHSGAHPFVCDDCGNGFTTSSSLVKHRRTHTGERPYACDLCPMRFAASGTLKNHRRTHTGEKPHKCQHCDKAFVQKNDLVSHTRCHTGERPYQCTTCGQAFRQSSALKTHLKLHQSRASMQRRQIPPVGSTLPPHLV